MCDTSSCQVDSKQRIHAVRFSEKPENIELGGAYKTTSPNKESSFTRRGILSKTRLTPALEDHYRTPSTSTDYDQEDCTARSSSAPTTNIALHHKDSIELILKRGISMTSKGYGVDYMNMRSKHHPKELSTKWKMKLWISKRQVASHFENNPSVSEKGTGILELPSGSDILDSSSEAPEESEAEFSSCSEDDSEDDNFMFEQYESSVDFQPSDLDSQSDLCGVPQSSVTQEEETDGDEEDPEVPKEENSS